MRGMRAVVPFLAGWVAHVLGRVEVVSPFGRLDFVFALRAHRPHIGVESLNQICCCRLAFEDEPVLPVGTLVRQPSLWYTDGLIGRWWKPEALAIEQKLIAAFGATIENYASA
jgi:hypothetical protein